MIFACLSFFSFLPVLCRLFCLVFCSLFSLPGANNLRRFKTLLFCPCYTINQFINTDSDLL